ncbi:MAG TPA: hypothetical protein VGA08_00130 [Candidatus Saccharimonadales bacterium]
MAEHIFLQRHQIEPADIHEVLDLTAMGQLEWGRDDRALAFGTNVDYSMGREIAIARNLLAVRVGFTPSEALNYLRMKDASEELYYVEDGSDEELLALANRVLKLGNIALTVPGGRLSGTIEDCGSCERETGHLTLYDAAHGIADMVMAGSERVECVSCGDTAPIAQAV